MKEIIIALISSFFGGFAAYYTLCFNYKELFACTVSSNRMEWINVWRESVSTFLACSEILYQQHDLEPDVKIQLEKEMYKARSMILIRLNLKEESHKEMLIAINEFNYQCDEKEFIIQRELVLAIARKILKPEWERVKDEARGTMYKRDKYQRIY